MDIYDCLFLAAGPPLEKIIDKKDRIGYKIKNRRRIHDGEKRAVSIF
jgi:hypothetical protein